MTAQEQTVVESSTNLPENQTLVQRLRIRASIRRSIHSRKSVQEGKPDRIASRRQSLDGEAKLLEEAANLIEYYQEQDGLHEIHRQYQDELVERILEYNKELERKLNDL